MKTNRLDNNINNGLPGFVVNFIWIINLFIFRGKFYYIYIFGEKLAKLIIIIIIVKLNNALAPENNKRNNITQESAETININAK